MQAAEATTVEDLNLCVLACYRADEGEMIYQFELCRSGPLWAESDPTFSMKEKLIQILESRLGLVRT